MPKPLPLYSAWLERSAIFPNASWVSKSAKLLTDVEVVHPPAVVTLLARLTSQRHPQYDLMEP